MDDLPFQLLLLRKEYDMNSFLIDTKKAFCNKLFLLSCAVSIALSVVCAVFSVKGYGEFREFLTVTEYNPLNPLNSLYTLWFGSGVRTKLVNAVLFALPLLAAMPYSWSVIHERKSNIAADGGISDLIRRILGVFLSSGAVIAAFLLVNLLANALFIPAIAPDSAYDIYYGVFFSDLFGDLFYSAPWLYMLIFIFACSAFGGLIGCCGCAFGIITKSRIAAVITPAIILAAVELLSNKLTDNDKVFSPISLFASADELFSNFSVAAVEAAFMLAFSLIIVFMCNVNNVHAPARKGALETVGD